MSDGEPVAVALTDAVIDYGPRARIGPVSVRVPEGGVLGLIGANGSGKTSVMRAICALEPLRSGCIEVFGIRVRPGVPVPAVGAMIEEPRFYPWLSAEDNLRMAAGGRPPWRARVRVRTVLEAVELGDGGHVRVEEFSQGMRQRLGLARALLGEPRLLVLDEATNGLDTGGIALMHRLLGSVLAEGTTIVLSSHMLAEVERLATTVVALRAGEVVASGTAPEITQAWGSLSEMYARVVEQRL